MPSKKPGKGNAPGSQTVPPYKYIENVPTTVIDTATLAFVPVTEPAVVAAIAAGQVIAADAAPKRKALIQQITQEDFRTTDNIIATMASWLLAIQTLYAARFTLTAIDTVNADCRVWYATASAKRVNGGALMVGTPTILDTDADAGAAAWAVTADVNGANFRVRVTGVSGRTISWSIVGEILRARPDGLVD